MTSLDAAYAQQRLRLTRTVTQAVAQRWAQLHTDRELTINATVAMVAAGQATMVRLVDAYMAAKSMQAVDQGAIVGLDASLYTTSTLRGVKAAAVYARPFGAYGAFRNQGADPGRAVEAAQASVAKLAATDLQLAQTHAARDWMRQAPWVVGYRRVLNPPSCELCTLAASRTYRVSELQPIHEHCDCGVEPLFGTEPVASVGTTVRVEDDPELGPRLMADNWSKVGPRLIEPPA